MCLQIYNNFCIFRRRRGENREAYRFLSTFFILFVHSCLSLSCEISQSCEHYLRCSLKAFRASHRGRVLSTCSSATESWKLGIYIYKLLSTFSFNLGRKTCEKTVFPLHFPHFPHPKLSHVASEALIAMLWLAQMIALMPSKHSSNHLIP